MDQVPDIRAVLYDRIFIHWKSTVTGICSGVAVIVPVLKSNGFDGKYVALIGALALAVTTALSKDK